MVSRENFIKCDECGGINVVDEEKVEEEPKKLILSMDEYIEKNKSYWMFGECVKPDIRPFVGTSYGGTRILRCRDCGFTREYFRVVYT